MSGAGGSGVSESPADTVAVGASLRPAEIVPNDCVKEEEEDDDDEENGQSDIAAHRGVVRRQRVMQDYSAKSDVRETRS